MKTANLEIKDAIVEAALPDVPFDGWTMACLEKAAATAGYSPAMVKSVFPNGVRHALVHLSGWADRQMLGRLAKTKPAPEKIREKIALAVRTRLDVLAPHKEAERLAVAFWARPVRKYEGAKLLWKTADAIWDWAGDTATDYNRYTKRALLCGVLGSSVLFWLTDASQGHAETAGFIDRRIADVLSLGKIVGRLKTA